MKILRKNTIILVAATMAIILACGKKKNADSTAGSSTVGGGGAVAGSVTGISTLSVVPDIGSILQSQSSTASLTGENPDLNDAAFSLATVGTPPNFKDIGSTSANILTYLIGTDPTTAIKADQVSGNFTDMKAQ